uniref:Lipoprotein n=1 Tax=Streptomyces phage Geonosis TaxID=3158856 RepID=A0AAU7GWA4_9CAUD
MKKNAGALGAITAATIGVALLTGCGSEKRDDDCRTATPIVMFLGTDHHYHYGSPTGKIVPATQVPKSARTAPGYKAPSAKVAPPPKVDLKKPGTSGGSVNKPAAPKPAAPAPRSGRR